jgi:geranylgeranyl pyrophosphate synthase
MAQLPQRNDFVLALQLAVTAACADGPALLKDALVYAVLNGGKRIRPSLCFAMASVLNVPVGRVLPVAVAIELVHAQSLVHDDLPCMDNDMERRGQPTVHIKYDEATAILVGDALLAQAFAVLTKPNSDLTGDEQARLVFELSHTYQQLVSGQSMDVLQLSKKTDEVISSSTAMQEAINRLKTAALFQFTVWSVAYLAKVPDYSPWRNLGEQIGLLFQQCDDWHDTGWKDESLKKQSAAQINQALKALQAECLTLNAKLEHILLTLMQPVLPHYDYSIQATV